MNCFQFWLFDGDAWWVVLFLWCGLMENFSLLQTYFKSEELSGIRKEDVICCMGDSAWVTRAAASENSSSLISFSLVFALGWTGCHLYKNECKRHPHHQGRWSIMLKNSMKSIGAQTQPCFMCFVIMKGHERMLRMYTCTHVHKNIRTYIHAYIYTYTFKISSWGFVHWGFAHWSFFRLSIYYCIVTFDLP